MNSRNDQAPGPTSGAAAAGGEGDPVQPGTAKKEIDTGSDSVPLPYAGPERRAQGYLIAEVVESPTPAEPARPSDFPA